MTEKRPKTLLAFALVSLAWVAHTPGADTSTYSVEPSTNEGKKWRLGYYQGGPYETYPVTLSKVVEKLRELGWIRNELQLRDALVATDVVETDQDDARKIWDYLAENAESDFLEFVSDAFWTANWNNDDKEAREKVKEAAIQRLAKRKDIDLVIAMGTWAGSDLANDRHSTPTLVFDASDPVGAKIIKSDTDSGLPHLHARVDPNRYRRQLELFYYLIGFERLGVCYIDNREGKSYAALGDVRAVASDKRFDVVAGTIAGGTSKRQTFEDTVACHRDLAPRIDAMYITEQWGIQLDRMDELLQPLEEHKVPTFAQMGAQFVEKGALMSIARASVDSVARFHAENIAKVLNGARPRDLRQIFEVPPKIAINLERAVRIGYDFPVPVLVTVDELY